MKNAKIGRAIMDADVFISLNHFKGHETAGFGGAIKNIGMGCGSRAGKMEQHAQGKPEIDESLCRGCKRCMKECANDGLVYDETTHKMHIDHENVWAADAALVLAILMRSTAAMLRRRRISTAVWQNMRRLSWTADRISIFLW